jgi:hypothetical protein
MLRLIWAGFIWLRSFIRSRHELGLQIIALRQQLVVLKRRTKRAHLRRSDRLFWVLLPRVAEVVESTSHREARHSRSMAQESLPSLLALSISKQTGHRAIERRKPICFLMAPLRILPVQTHFKRPDCVPGSQALNSCMRRMNADELTGSGFGDVFILGAGFSKAVSTTMPLLSELSAAIASRPSSKERLPGVDSNQDSRNDAVVGVRISSSSLRVVIGVALKPGDEIRIEGSPDGSKSAALDYIEIQ